MFRNIAYRNIATLALLDYTVMFILVSYDIPDNKRRTKVAKILEGYGDRVQYSVFECDLPARHIEKMLKEISGVLNESEDSVRVYRLCRSCAPKIMVKGQGRPPADTPEVYIV